MKMLFASFTADTLDGGTFTQDDIAAKDATVINFWALSCPPCIAELPDLAAYAKTLPENVQFITVCLDAGIDMDAVKEASFPRAAASPCSAGASGSASGGGALSAFPVHPASSTRASRRHGRSALTYLKFIAFFFLSKSSGPKPTLSYHSLREISRKKSVQDQRCSGG